MKPIKDSNMFIKMLVCVSGLFTCAVGQYLMTRATMIGLGAWECFQTGVSFKFGIAYGNVVIMVGVCILVIDVLLKGKIGIGTICNTFMIGWFINIFNHFQLIDYIENVWLAVPALILGMCFHATGSYIYMQPCLGCGPRDTLMVQIGKKFPKANIAVIKYAQEMAAFTIGVLLGAPLGIGSLISILCAAYVYKSIFKFFKFEPRTLTHESIADTLGKLVK
ncbi:MAG: hypothetical protein MJ186_05565 [Clostridia bacterium]|nr:hypothetical protein [Clostridia bacterium]